MTRRGAVISIAYSPEESLWYYNEMLLGGKKDYSVPRYFLSDLPPAS